MYTINEAKAMAVLLENGLSGTGLHIGLAGGTLTKTGERKDIDFLLYQKRKYDSDPERCVSTFLSVAGGLFEVTDVERHGFVTKMKLNGIPVDLLFPEWPRNLKPDGSEYEQ